MRERMEENCEKVIPSNTFYSRYVKRVLDFLISLFALIVLSPILLIMVTLELIFHGRPVIYASHRPGKDGKIFCMYKFRSMTNQTDENGDLLPEEKRLTSFGRFIRRTSLDELPELFNILKGDMSIIGPRPLLVEYLKLYNPRHAQRHLVRPGLACFRIIPSDSKTWTWREQFDNDIWYIEHISFLTDVKMIFAIAKKVFGNNDTRANDTRVLFDGTNLDETRSKKEVEEEKENTAKI